jgi:hypothetical protein
MTQSLELYDVYQAKMLHGDRKLEVLIEALSNKRAKPIGKLSKPRVKTKQVNTPTFDVRTALYGVLGLDVIEIHRIEAHRRVRHGFDGMAERQALHLLALPRTRQQDLRWQGAVLTHTAIIKSGSRTVAAGRHYDRAERYSARTVRCRK